MTLDKNPLPLSRTVLLPGWDVFDHGAGKGCFCQKPLKRMVHRCTWPVAYTSSTQLNINHRQGSIATSTPAPGDAEASLTA